MKPIHVQAQWIARTLGWDEEKVMRYMSTDESFREICEDYRLVRQQFGEQPRDHNAAETLGALTREINDKLTINAPTPEGRIK